VSSPPEMDALDPQARFLTLEDGMEVEVVPLKTRQLFRMLRILTHSAGGRLLDFNFNLSAEDFTERLVVLFALSIPDAEDETIEFLRSMVQPAGLMGKGKSDRQLNKQEREHNDAAWAKVNAVMFNPDPMDTMSLIEAIVRLESPHLQSLGKALAAMLPTALRAELSGRTPPTSSESQGESSSESSAGPTTSSPASTGGRTTVSVSSLLDGSARSSQPLESAGTSAPSSAGG
jgi:hypothetical protein